MEVEAKLAVDRLATLSAIARRRRLGPYALRAVAAQALEAVYFDTEARDLLRHGAALRLPRTSAGLELTLKRSGVVASGIHRRPESTWRLPRMPPLPLRLRAGELRNRSRAGRRVGTSSRSSVRAFADASWSSAGARAPRRSPRSTSSESSSSTRVRTPPRGHPAASTKSRSSYWVATIPTSNVWSQLWEGAIGYGRHGCRSSSGRCAGRASAPPLTTPKVASRRSAWLRPDSGACHPCARLGSGGCGRATGAGCPRSAGVRRRS